GSGGTMTAVLWSTVFNGLTYVIAEFDSTTIHHFYDGTLITDWDGGASNPTDKGEIALTFGDFVYSPGASVLYRCKLRDPTEWTDGQTGVDQINMANHNA